MDCESVSSKSGIYTNCLSLPPANEVCEGYVFTGVCLSTLGGHAWFYSGGKGGMRGFILGGIRGFIWGGMHGFIWGAGACVVLFGGGVCGFIRGSAWFYSGGAWFYLGGCVHGFIWGGMHGFIWGGVRGFFSFFGYNEIRSMSGRYASYWNAFLLFPVISFCFIWQM